MIPARIKIITIILVKGLLHVQAFAFFHLRMCLVAICMYCRKNLVTKVTNWHSILLDDPRGVYNYYLSELRIYV